MSGKFRLDDKIDFQNMSTKCIDSMIDCIGPSFILKIYINTELMHIFQVSETKCLTYMLLI